MRGTLIAGLLVVSSVAVAKPLPTGMKVVLSKQKVVVQQGGVSVPLPISYPVQKLSAVQLTDDGKSISLKTDRCDGMFGEADEPDEFALAPIQAKLENALGMTFHTKKKYGDAITHFTAAIAADPQPVYVTNLLSAQAMSGKLDDADKTIATWGKRYTPWFAWRLAVDPELKKLAGRPSTKLGPDKPGKATSKLLGNVAYSPLGFAAIETVADSGWEDMGGDTNYELVFVELASGREILRLPTETECFDPDGADMGPDMAAYLKACKKKSAAKTPKQRKVADAILASLGFDIVPNAAHDPKNEEAIKTPEGKTLKTDDQPDGAWTLYFVPKYTVWENRHKIVTGCAGDGDLHMEVTATPR